MVALVEPKLDLHKKLAAAKLNHEKNTLQRQIAATDKQMDELAYELYRLAPARHSKTNRGRRVGNEYRIMNKE